ncbi:MAG: DNA-binding response regulator [Alteromonadaceae bacterium]|jgi:two-component system OmpR family response regulator|uniref:Transcriptional regulatory protein ompR n=1 Tax=Paraglaciecola mesophila KMM 241 TaxID=1128912 RepID=K6YF74_9ALTE|nr:response regulator transcription factor [Paraglaciecola mesophila]MAD14874.1 DNA-binding response regulator [Alteromonadaceae bacterium]GAC22641.1 transcriptional regulatory protein ompR [Paraglaciecola mesophila KMM 241]|tara:strand:- start:2163 stop:2897 length:735 start_codon:yes stop_codon:yes gene_type:complete
MKNEKYKILLVDDDETLCALLSEFLQEEGFEVETLHSGNAATERLLQSDEFDTVVLDIMMPGMSGLDVLRNVRAKRQVPILMLTGRGDDIDRIVGLEMGADDYLGKPCNPRELSARIKAIIRRTENSLANGAPGKAIVHTLLHGIELDTGTRTAVVNNNILPLTSAEFNALSLLMERAGQTITKQDMTQEVLNRPLEAYDRAMDVHISRIRQKLSSEGINDVIKSIRGVGYQMLTEQQPAQSDD